MKFTTTLQIFLLVASSAVVNSASRLPLVKYKEFREAAVQNGFPVPSQDQYNGFTNSLPLSGIFTKTEAAMALAQILWESNGLQVKTEPGCKKNGGGCQTKYRTKGCEIAGQQYHGRGYLKLRGCHQYLAASLELYGNTDLIYDPDIVSKNETVSWETSMWYWRKYVHSKPGLVVGLFGATTRALNPLECVGGPLESLAKQRFEVYETVRKAFGYLSQGDERGCYDDE